MCLYGHVSQTHTHTHRNTEREREREREREMKERFRFQIDYAANSSINFESNQLCDQQY